MVTVRAHTAVLLIMLLLAPGSFAPAMAQEAKLPPEQALKAQLIEIPTGSVIEVKLRNKEKRRGKLGEMRDADFDLQRVKDGKVVTEALRLADVKGVKVQGKGMSLPLKIVTGTLIGAGVLMVIGLIAAAAVGCC
jgi:hypothetical protein